MDGSLHGCTWDCNYGLAQVEVTSFAAFHSSSFYHTSDKDQKRQAEHLHRGLPELDVISLASNANTIGTTILRRTSRRQTMIYLAPRLLATPSMTQLPPTALVPLNDFGLV